MIERSKSHSDAKSWDKVIMPLAAGLLPFFGWIIAGLNNRWGWQPAVGRSWHFAGLLLTIIGHLIVLRAMSENSFFSTLV